MTETPTPEAQEELDRVLSGEAEHVYFTPKEARYLAAVEAALAELDEIAAYLARVDDLYERRLRLYFLLRHLGVTFPVIASHTESKVSSVRMALEKARQQVATGHRPEKSIDPRATLRELQRKLSEATG